MYITICEIVDQSKFDAETGHSGPVHWNDPEGWDGEEDEREAQDGEHMYIPGFSMSMYGKNHYNIVK